MDESLSYYGEIALGKIINHKNDNVENDNLPMIDNSNVLAVHYPDCQQISVRLPSHHSYYQNISILNKHTGFAVFNKNVADIVSGTILIIIDTLPFPPGDYIITFSSQKAIVHEIEFFKLTEGEKMPQEPVIQPQEQNDESGCIVYRDGNGNIIKYDNDDRWRELFY